MRKELYFKTCKCILTLASLSQTSKNQSILEKGVLEDYLT
jgi:hypothetical protein